MKKIFMFLLITASFFAETAYAASVKIGVIDTGVSVKDGLIDESRIMDGKNYVFEDGDTDDLVGHGTRVAGLITGTQDGVINSPSSESLIVPLVYYSKYVSGTVKNGGIEAICSAVYDAVDVFGCDIINISSGVSADDQRLESAARYAEENGVLVISSCGNDGGDTYYPAGYDTVLGVGSHDGNNEPSEFSSKGRGVDLLTSGENLTVVSLKNAEDYEKVKGTSYSAAIMTAYAASALEKYPELKPGELRGIMKASCYDICEYGYDEESGYGIFSDDKFYENLKLFGDGELVFFMDVSDDAWYYENIKTAYQNGWLGGTGDVTFEPELDVTRAMFVSALYRAEGEPQTDRELMFYDVADDSYYCDAVRWALDKGLVEGYTDTVFAPDDVISREEAAVIMKRYSGDTIMSGYDISCFTDKDDISDWAQSAVKWALETGVMNGKSDDRFEPKSTLTRAELSAVLQRFYSVR